MTTKIWSAFLASTVLAGLATYGFTAHAFVRRHNSMSCIADPQQQNAWEFINGDRRWNDPSTRGRLFCPVLHDDSLPVRSINWIFVQGWLANHDPYPELSDFTAKPCVSFWGGGGGACGTGLSDGGFFTQIDMSVDPSHFFPSTSVDYRDYPYVIVLVPAVSTGGGVSSVRGLVWGT